VKLSACMQVMNTQQLCLNKHYMFCHKDEKCNCVLTNGCGNKCTTSADSFSDYGQVANIQTGLGLIMYSATTAQSTMDFSMLPVDDGVVDSPPNGGKRIHHRSGSPSPLKCQLESTSPRICSAVNPVTQRKLYDKDVVIVSEVMGCVFFVLDCSILLKSLLLEVKICKSLMLFVFAGCSCYYAVCTPLRQGCTRIRAF
jgi:hypothetical protein